MDFHKLVEKDNNKNAFVSEEFILSKFFRGCSCGAMHQVVGLRFKPLCPAEESFQRPKEIRIDEGKYSHGFRFQRKFASGFFATELLLTLIAGHFCPG